MKRLFTAIKIQPDLTFFDSYRALMAILAHEKIKWTETHNFHITLKFFGDTPEKIIPIIKDLLRQSTMAVSPFKIQLNGLGIFGSIYLPRVIWVGIEPYKEMSDLLNNLHEKFVTAGFNPDRQNLVPHLTLGRIKKLADKVLFKKVMEQHQEISSLPIHVDHMILFESILRKEGPEYIVLDRFPFHGKHPIPLPVNEMG